MCSAASDSPVATRSIDYSDGSSSMMRARAPSLVLVLFLFFSATCGGAACARAADVAEAAPFRLRVVLYPFIPDFPGFTSSVISGFRATPDGANVTVDPIDLTSGYYSPADPAFIGSAKADVYEIDSVFLNDFVNASNGFPGIQPLPKALIDEAAFLPSAANGAKVGATWYGVPHWVCSNLLFYRIGDTALASAKTISDLEAVWPTQPTSQSDGLLVDLKGKSTLGEFYLMAELDRQKNLEAAYQALKGPPDPAITTDMLTLRRYCAIGYCRDQNIHDNEPTYYAQQFARRAGRAYVGYSEGLNGVLTEAATCKPSDRCLRDADIGVNLLPLDSSGITPMVWVDSFVIAKSCVSECLTRATAFIKYVTSAPSVLTALLGDSKGIPRYLMPARTSLFTNPTLVAKAHLYPSLLSLVTSASAPSSLSLNAELRNDGTWLDQQLGP